MIAIRFDGPPAHLSGRFVEIEQDGKSISLGEWKRDGKDWLLILPNLIISYCAIHKTYPIKGEPCWQCANPHIAAATKEMSQFRAGHKRYRDLYRLECNISDDLKVKVAKLEANIDDLEKVLFSLSTGNGIPNKYHVTYHHQAGRCKVHQRVKHPFGDRSHLQAVGEILDREARDAMFSKEGVMETITSYFLVIAEEIGIDKLVERLAAVFKEREL